MAKPRPESFSQSLHFFENFLGPESKRSCFLIRTCLHRWARIDFFGSSIVTSQKQSGITHALDECGAAVAPFDHHGHFVSDGIPRPLQTKKFGSLLANCFTLELPVQDLQEKVTYLGQRSEE